MEIESLQLAKQIKQQAIVAEPVSERIRNKDRMTLSASLRQVLIERMAIIGRPNEAVLAQFLSQLEPHDVEVVVNMMKYALKTAVRSYRYLMTRFRFMVRAVKCIRCFWLASRFRFSSKIQRLILQWRRDEDEARRKLLSRGRNKKSATSSATGGENSVEKSPARSKGAITSAPSGDKSGASPSKAKIELDDEDDFTLQQFISLAAPVELKRRVLIRQYKLLQRDFRLTWRQWCEKRRQYNARLSQLAGQHAGDAGSTNTANANPSLSRKDKSNPSNASSASLSSSFDRKALLELGELPPEPQFKWLEQLGNLTAGERFELCLQYQLRRQNANNAKEEKHQHHHFGDVDHDDGWVAVTLAVVSRHTRQIEERVAHGGGAVAAQRGGPASIVTYLPKFGEVKSKFMSSPMSSGSAPLRRMNRYGEMVTCLPSASTALSATTMLELKAELPTLARFKSDPWNVPPKPQPDAKSASPSHAESNRFDQQRPRSVPVGSAVSAKRSLRDSETISLSMLDPMAKSLVLRGVLRPPARPATGSRSAADITMRRQERMAAAAEELARKYKHLSPEGVIRSDRFKQMLYAQHH